MKLVCYSVTVLIFLSSCASLHTPTPHFIPSITKKRQFEGEASAGLNAVSLGLAYSPVSHLTVMGNVQSLPVKNKAAHYQRNCELALGTYGSRSRLIYGLNVGYGLGAYNWNYPQFNDSTAYTLHTKGNFQKLMLQLFFAVTDDAADPSWLAGLSLKENFFWDQYASLKYAAREFDTFSGLRKQMSFEPCIFARHLFTRRFYLNLQAGMNISYDDSMFWPVQYLFTRIGVGLRL